MVSMAVSSSVVINFLHVGLPLMYYRTRQKLQLQ